MRRGTRANHGTSAAFSERGSTIARAYRSPRSCRPSVRRRAQAQLAVTDGELDAAGDLGHSGKHRQRPGRRDDVDFGGRALLPH